MELEVEVFAVGTWNGMPFEKNDLMAMASSFNSLKEFHDVPLKFGHNDEQPFTDGQPALGWVGELFVSGEKLMAKFIDMPKIVHDAMKKKLYKHVSIELDMGVEHKGNFYDLVLSGVALLGADIPAVNTIGDLTTYMSKEKLSFKKRAVFSTASTETKERSNEMADESEELKALKLKLSASQAETAKLVTSNQSLEKEKIDNKVKFKAVEAAEEHRKGVEERNLLETRLDAMVKEKKIAPFTRDGFLTDYDQAKDKSVITYAVESMEKTIDANPQYFGAEQARLKADKNKQEGDLNFSQIVVARAREYMAKHGEKNFAVAKTAVLRADLELAANYTKMEVA
ncbi:hypothetical protein KAR91_47775 [Candidatus Pacearchaeota archaeon]|nr:hypothetical protein [Candidatus Pacearchaeota archaeon]